MSKSFSYSTFKAPPNSFRPVPFWSLNGILENEKLSSQIRDFKEMGFGGYFMHPRPGMKVPYLEDEWFEKVKCMVNAGTKEGLEPWLYDEDSYPSGFAAGAVPELRPDLRPHALCLVKMKQLAEISNILEQFMFLTGTGNICSEDTAEYAIISTRDENSYPWYNNQSYVDTLNPDTIRCFLDCTHEKYVAALGELLGSCVSGVFTDEPHHTPFAVNNAVARLPWTPTLPKVFLHKYGYDLRKEMYGLFFDSDNNCSVRFDFFNLVNEMFVNNFCKPMFDWCEKHGLELTGHLWEHHYPIVTSQADIMTPLKYMHRPGIDLLGRDVDKFAFGESGKKLPAQVGNWQMIIAASSVARQYGRARVMSETWGGCGWDQTMEDHKRTVDWEMILGINYVVPHLSHYTLEGYRKADYPISFTRVLPYWKRLRLLTDHITRVCYAMSCGTSMARIMVIHPACHNWINYNNDDDIDRHAVELEKLTRWLVTNQYWFDFGDEILLREDGWVRDGKIGIAEAEYDIVIIPPTCCLHASTYDKMKVFAESGGTIINFSNTTPSMIDGRKSDEMMNCFSGKRISKFFDFDGLGDALRSRIEKPLTIKSSCNQIASMIRHDNQNLIAFIANLATKAEDLALKFSESGKLHRIDTLTGDLKTMAPVAARENLYCLHLAEGESCLLMLDTAKPPSNSSPERYACEEKEIKRFSGKFEFKKLDPNIMLLDHCQYAINDEPFSELIQLEQALMEFKSRYGLEYSPGLRYTREYSRNNSILPKNNILKLRFPFKIEEGLDIAGIKLATEIPEKWEIYVNGALIKGVSNDFFMDHCFGVMPIGENLKKGINEINMNAKVADNPNPANIFLLGDFGVKTQAEIMSVAEEAKKLDISDITKGGFPFFGGRIVYDLPFMLVKEDCGEEIIVRLNDINAPVIDCSLNGNFIGSIYTAPYELSLGFLPLGKHELKITLYTHLKNVFGPHYTGKSRKKPIVGCQEYSYIYEGKRKNSLETATCGVSSNICLLSRKYST